MMATKASRVFVCDFETTVYDGQVTTEVWAAACVEVGTEDVQVFHSIDEQFEFFCGLGCNVTAYYHNLKFDGNFWLSYLMRGLHYEQAYTLQGDDIATARWIEPRDMKSKTYRYSISDMGQWYSITIKKGRYTIEIRDSLKLLPFSVERIGQSFGTKHKKLSMEYKGIRWAGCEITDEEREYIANDVLVVKEALEIMFAEGHQKLTIGSCCLSEYKKIIGKDDFDMYFPNLYEIPIDPQEHGCDNAGEWIRRSYRGGWCYLARGKEGRVYHGGTTADVNSLYPSVMSSESGSWYPVGRPTFWTGDRIPEEATKFQNRYYFVRVRCRFKVKGGYLPFIQLKGNALYKGTEMLEQSDIWDKASNRYSRWYKGMDGQIHDTVVEMTLTQTDYQLILEHYNLIDLEILDGCWFFAEIGLFDAYIDKYRRIKMESKGAKRELAKLFLNNLYGKMGASPDSSFKVAVEKEDGSLGFVTVVASDKEPGYIPIGSAITSYARNFTICAAQKNYHGPDAPGFIYADTDSIHCDLPPEELEGIRVDDKAFCCWKLESCWDEAIFTRQKTYIEHVTHENLEPVEEPYYIVKCAGMPRKCKNLFLESMRGDATKEGRTQEELDFLFDGDGNPIVRTLEDFQIGLCVPGKLRPKRIPGGVLLVETMYEMR